MDYVSAFEHSRQAGSLATHAMHDTLLSKKRIWNGHKDLYLKEFRETRRSYPAWTLDVLAYTREGERFRPGADHVDLATGWVLPASYLSALDESLGLFARRDAASVLLFPRALELSRGNAVIHPYTMHVVASPVHSEVGLAHQLHRFPLIQGTDTGSGTPLRFRRSRENGLRPLARTMTNTLDELQADRLPDEKLHFLIARND
jgi:hypothetical protein